MKIGNYNFEYERKFDFLAFVIWLNLNTFVEC